MKSDYETIIKLVNYFKENRTTNNLFEPEYLAGKKILNVLKKGPLKRDQVEFIQDTLNWICKEEHYNGSGWSEFMITIERILENGKV